MEQQNERKKPGTKINSKKKGSEYELKIAKVLSAYWGEEFHRTPASGGLHWKQDNRVAGDIVTPPDSVYPWVTECKKREAWTFDQLIKSTGEIESYWKQVCRDSNETGLRPLLIFSKNYEPNYMMMHHNDFLTLMGHCGYTVAPFNTFIIHKPNNRDRVICVLEEFIAKVTKQSVIEAFGLDQ